MHASGTLRIDIAQAFVWASHVGNVVANTKGASSEANIQDRLRQFLIQRYRDSEANLPTTFGNICDWTGVARSAKPFMNCRSTRRNELERQGAATPP